MGLSEAQIGISEITESVCIPEGADTRASGISGLCHHLLKYQNFLSMNSMSKELYCISEAALCVLNLNCDLL